MCLLLPMAIGFPKTPRFPRLSRRIRLSLMALWSPAGEGPVSGPISTAISRGERFRSVPRTICIWDTELPGFGLRVRPTGRYYWCVRVRHPGIHKRVSLGRTNEVDAETTIPTKSRSFACSSYWGTAWGDSRSAMGMGAAAASGAARQQDRPQVDLVEQTGACDPGCAASTVRLPLCFPKPGWFGAAGP